MNKSIVRQGEASCVQTTQENGEKAVNKKVLTKFYRV